MDLSPHQQRLRVTKLLDQKEVVASLVYHDLFDYPLSFDEVELWRTSALDFSKAHVKFENYFYLKGRERIVLLRESRERNSKGRIERAMEASRILAFLPTLKFVGITGSLSMMNTRKNSDIDLMIVTSSKTLWTTRLIAFLLLSLFGFKLRRFGKKESGDSLCINMWLTRDNLVWNMKDRNIFTAHEICQIMPVLDRGGIYRKLVKENEWIYDYWPGQREVKKKALLELKGGGFWRDWGIWLFRAFEPLAYLFQRVYMSGKRTREKVSLNYAFFHPVDWSEKVKKRIEERGGKLV